jgi:hypothetical protein
MEEQLSCCGLTFKEKAELEEHMQEAHGRPEA